MKISEKILALQVKRKLMRQLDASLLAHAAALCDSPSVDQVYQLRGLRKRISDLRISTGLLRRMSQVCSALSIRSKSQISAAG